MNNLKSAVKRRLKTLLRPLIFRYPPVGLEPERLQYWLRTLIDTREVEGCIVEVGCHLGGTTAVSWKMLRNLKATRRYVCIDTFGGFVEEQFEDDLGRGNVKGNRWLFADNSMSLTRSILNQHNAKEVELVRGDITTLDEAKLPDKIAVALLDIDLAGATYEGLKRLYPRLAEGGAILVDDCPEKASWQARQGYEQFCREENLVPTYELGLGVVRR